MEDNMMERSMEMTKAEREAGRNEAEGSKEAQRYLREMRMQDAKRAEASRSARKSKR